MHFSGGGGLGWRIIHCGECEHAGPPVATGGEQGDARGGVTGRGGQRSFSRKDVLATRGGVLGCGVTVEDEEQDGSFRSDGIFSFRSVSISGLSVTLIGT